MSDPHGTEDRGGTIEVDGARIHYSRTGSGRAPLVLLHGLTDDGACWSRVAAVVAEDFDLVVPDAREIPAVAAGWLMRRLGLPAVIGYLAVGSWCHRSRPGT